MKKDNLIKFLHQNGKKPKEISEDLKVTIWYVYKVLKIEGIKGYKNSAKNAVYATEEYKEFRKRVLERDKYTCQHCGKSGTKLNPLQVEHLKPKATYPELIFEMSNCIVLCRSCHSKQPSTKTFRRLNKR